MTQCLHRFLKWQTKLCVACRNVQGPATVAGEERNFISDLINVNSVRLNIFVEIFQLSKETGR